MTTVESKKGAEKGVIPYLPEEIDAFEQEVGKFRSGENAEDVFIRFRLKQGVYGQRQPEAQMFRVKLPFGGVTADQLETLGDFTDEFTPLKKGHITTRENIQFHHILLDRSAEGLRLLGSVGLTTREACGNTVRNVAGCPLAGVCGGEPFDPTPYLTAYARYFVRHPLTQAFPRKLKTAFSGCAHDCAMTAIHDLGFIAQTREVNGETVRGFKIVVGGGTSIMARLAPTLYEFVSVDDYLRVSEAVFRVFDAADELRKNRMKARIKFLVDRIGIDEFRTLVDAELARPWAQEKIDPEPWMFDDDEAAGAPPPPTPSRFVNGSASPEFTAWATTNVKPQRQEGYAAVEVTVPQGDLTGDQFRGLGAISRNYSGGRVRLTQEQNLVLRWVRTELVHDVWNDLKALDLVEGGADEITDVVTCPGTDSCKLGITSSMGLGQALREKIAALDTTDPQIKKMHVKASGCPNGCGQHHIASIGFHGAAIKGGSGQQVPAYEVFVGGNATGTEGPIRFGQRVRGRVPAKLAPEFIERVLDFYTRERESSDERFLDFVDRVGPEAFSPLLADLQQVGPLGKDTIQLYMDWTKTIPFKVERGEGECAV